VVHLLLLLKTQSFCCYTPTGHLYCLNAATGVAVWTREIKDYLAELTVNVTGESPIGALISACLLLG